MYSLLHRPTQLTLTVTPHNFHGEVNVVARKIQIFDPIERVVADFFLHIPK